jgi:hypothetical protein
MKRTKDLLIERMEQEYKFESGLRFIKYKKYSDMDLYHILLSFVEFKHDYHEPRGIIVNRFIEELNRK